MKIIMILLTVILSAICSIFLYNGIGYERAVVVLLCVIMGVLVGIYFEQKNE